MPYFRKTGKSSFSPALATMLYIPSYTVGCTHPFSLAIWSMRRKELSKKIEIFTFVFKHLMNPHSSPPLLLPFPLLFLPCTTVIPAQFSPPHQPCNLIDQTEISKISDMEGKRGGEGLHTQNGPAYVLHWLLLKPPQRGLTYLQRESEERRGVQGVRYVRNTRSMQVENIHLLIEKIKYICLPFCISFSFLFWPSFFPHFPSVKCGPLHPSSLVTFPFSTSLPHPHLVCVKCFQTFVQRGFEVVNFVGTWKCGVDFCIHNKSCHRR
jgi:hypothetical protein